MRTENASIVYRLLAVVLLAALLLAPAPGAVRAETEEPEAAVSTTRRVVTSIQYGGAGVTPDAVVDPDLETGSVIGLLSDQRVIPGSTFYITYQIKPIRTYSNEHMDSFSINNGPLNWTVVSITNAPANNRGNGRAVGQASLNPQTGGNTTNYAHAYWGWDDPNSGPATYINGTTITYPTRTYDDPYYSYGVYTAAASPGGAEVDFTVTWNVPSSWTAYRCPGTQGAYSYVGFSGVNTDPNYIYGTLRSSSSYSGWQDVNVWITDPCPLPAVSVTKTGTVTGVTGNSGQTGTVKVRYCFTVANATTTANGVDLASYVVTDSTIGYNSGTRTVTLTPGASAPLICAPYYTFYVTWPTSGGLCVYNTSGASVTATTPSGFRPISNNDPSTGFTNGTFTTAAVTGGVNLRTCAVPLAVDLASFTAEATAEGATLAWETVSETDNAGFNVYRADSEAGPWTQVNAELIPALTPGSAQGNTYTWTDAAPAAGTIWYMLEDVALDGTATQHAPVSVTAAAPSAEPNAVSMTAFGAAGGAMPALGGLAGLALAVLAGVARKRR